MQHLVSYLLLAAVLIGLVLAVRRIKGQLRSKHEELNAFEGEEQRMFAFLHDLGSAIGSDTTMTGLYRLIVEGVDKVVTARGGALYLLEESLSKLQPK